MAGTADRLSAGPSLWNGEGRCYKADYLSTSPVKVVVSQIFPSFDTSYETSFGLRRVGQVLILQLEVEVARSVGGKRLARDVQRASESNQSQI